MSDDDDFEWTFPVYALVANYTHDPDSGVRLDDDIRFATIDSEQGFSLLLLFTDRDLADTFREQHLHRDSLTVLVLVPESMLELLERAEEAYPMLAVDPNRAIHKIHPMVTSEVIQWLRDNPQDF